MIEPLDQSQLPAPARKILGEGAPEKLRLAAARGIVPGLKPADIACVLVVLAEGTDQAAETAQRSLAKLPAPVLNGALDADLPAQVIDVFARTYPDQVDLAAKLLRMPRLAIDTVEWLAQHGGEAITELVATNQERMAAHPRIIELLYKNKKTRMSTADRIVEFAVRSGIELPGIAAWKEAAQAITGELIVESSDEALPEDIEFWQTDKLATELADKSFVDTHEELEDGSEQVQERYIPLYKRIADMSISQKIRRAMLGSREERALLVRDQNRLVAAAAARSEQLQEPEVIQIARNRNVLSDVLFIIGTSPEWTKSYQVKRNLVENPRLSPMLAQRLIVQLRESDLRKIARSKNVSSAVRTAANRHLSRRSK